MSWPRIVGDPSSASAAMSVWRRILSTGGDRDELVHRLSLLQDGAGMLQRTFTRTSISSIDLSTVPGGGRWRAQPSSGCPAKAGRQPGAPLQDPSRAAREHSAESMASPAPRCSDHDRGRAHSRRAPCPSAKIAPSGAHRNDDAADPLVDQILHGRQHGCSSGSLRPVSSSSSSMLGLMSTVAATPFGKAGPLASSATNFPGGAGRRPASA